MEIDNDVLECCICDNNQQELFPDKIMECNCGMTICKRCLASYGNICPGCGKP